MPILLRMVIGVGVVGGRGNDFFGQEWRKTAGFRGRAGVKGIGREPAGWAGYGSAPPILPVLGFLPSSRRPPYPQPSATSAPPPVIRHPSLRSSASCWAGPPTGQFEPTSTAATCPASRSRWQFLRCSPQRIVRPNRGGRAMGGKGKALVLGATGGIGGEAARRRRCCGMAGPWWPWPVVRSTRRGGRRWARSRTRPG